ncbi:hypothetical protein ETB97_000869 [Aspergillus alliaceus]|uniref:Uncharacterized protein n=1 Tax=Petromyces alliaceus TaxID=209559 RepID=A0A8H6A6C3_PETAA|nr:hypothetical protein ETB97_000869 [Aspergillus burnettii]
MRDIGESRRKRPRPHAVTFAWQQLDDWQSPPTKSLDCNPLPVQLDSRSLQLIHFMQAEVDYNYRPFRAVWFSMALHDHSAFKLCMANAAMFLDEATHPETFRYETSGEALMYYGQCVNQITHRLGDSTDCISEGVLTTILGLICHDLYVGTWDRWAYHIRGLKQVLLLRGGLNGLSDNLRLFALWFDVLGSAIHDMRPQLSEYPTDENTQPPQTGPGCAALRILRRLTRSQYPSEMLVMALNRVLTVSDFVNARYTQTGFWKEENDLSPLEMLAPAIHILLSMPRPQNPNLSPFENVHEMTRLALLILIAELKRAYGLPANEIQLLRTKCADLLRNTNIDDGLSLFPSLWLWILVTIALHQPLGPERGLCLTYIAQQMPTLNIPDGQSAIKMARDIVWIEVLARPDTVQSLISEIDIARSA